jgi:hypothetical protein
MLRWLEVARRIAIVIGIVLSIAWTGYWMVQKAEQLHALKMLTADGAKASCERKNAAGGPQEDCATAWFNAFFEADKQKVELADLILILIPVGLAWLIAYGIVAAIRWVAEGFGKAPPI